MLVMWMPTQLRTVQVRARARARLARGARLVGLLAAAACRALLGEVQCTRTVNLPSRASREARVISTFQGFTQ